VKTPASRRLSGDKGAYAILYAALVVVMIGMSAVVVDIASLRQDRRDNRDAADAASLGAAEFINPLKTIQPRNACLRAWAYLESTLSDITTPGTACNSFTTLPGGVTAAAYCTGAPALIRDERVVGDRTIVVAWPVPKDDPATSADESENFLDPDVAPSETVTQEFSSDRDGSPEGCDRIGVAILQDRAFGLAGGIGAEGQRTSVHSVARFNAKDGPADQVAALNVLQPRDCRALVTTGSGKVVVGPTFKNGDYAGPGIIAVESDGNGACAGSATGSGGERVIDPNTTSAGSLICASNVKLNPLLANAGCDGNGVIQSHAMDPGGQRPYRGYPLNLKPRPEPEGGVHGWFPVTRKYGCHSLNPCMPPGESEPPYIDALYSAYGGTGDPGGPLLGSVYRGDLLYNNPFNADFQRVPAEVCSNITTTIALDAGNWYADCSIDIRNGGTLVVRGGTLVVEGGLSIASGSTGGCFVMNIDRANCAAATDVLYSTTGSTPSPDASTAYTALDQASTGIVFLRGRSCGSACTFNHQGNLFMAKTFVYAGDGAKEMSVNSTKTTFWTAPGAGRIVSNNHTALEVDCIVDTSLPPADQVVSTECLNSRFSRLNYWSEYAAPKTKPNTFNGQGSLNVVGVFFTPNAYFNFAGGSSYSAASAQFWADKLNVDGGAFLGLTPDARTAIESPAGAISLIR
jgi:hypothetical protein